MYTLDEIMRGYPTYQIIDNQTGEIIYMEGKYIGLCATDDRKWIIDNVINIANCRQIFVEYYQ